MPENRSNFDEITLAIGLLGGVIVVLLYISDYFNNNAIPLDADLRSIVYSFVYILLLEIPIILLFFLFKGISIYAKPESSEVIKKVAQKLFTISFIYFLLYIIAIISTLLFVNFIYYNIELSNRSTISQLYHYILLILLIIIGLILWDYSKFKSIFHALYAREATEYSFGEFWRINKKLVFIFIVAIVVVYIGILINNLFSSLSLYLLMGSYSIEEFLQPNDGNITIGIKETGIISNATFIDLYKKDTDFDQRKDTMNITHNQVSYSMNGSMTGAFNQHLSIWYLNINTSKLQPGNYMLYAEVTRLKNPTLGTVKKQTGKLFYIPPKNASYSFNCTQTS